MGIEIVPNLTGGGNSSDIVLIENTAITLDRADGIVVANTSDVRIEDCIITGQYAGEEPFNPLFAAIRLTTASPTILRTTMSQHDYGLLAVSYSLPVLQDENGPGDNIITNNRVGVKCDDHSDAVLGTVSPFELPGGQNCIDNYEFDVHLKNTSIVVADNDYWGNPNGPDPLKLWIEDDSKLVYPTYLSSCPGGDWMLTEHGEEGDNPPSEFDHPLMRRAISYRVLHQWQSAMTLLRGVVADPQETSIIKQWALRELLWNVAAARATGHAGYLRALTNAQLRNTIRGTLAQALLNRGEVESARQEWGVNIQNYPNSLLECGALYGKFIVALYRDHNLIQAGDLYLLLSVRYPTAHQTLLAQSQLALEHARQSRLGKSEEHLPATTVIPSQYRLEQNYPNPFNPVTSISYSLPIDAHVTLKVYDVLGREAATLVDGFVDAGVHQIAMDGSTMASGLYFYRLQAGAFVSVKKLMVLK